MSINVALPYRVGLLDIAFGVIDLSAAPVCSTIDVWDGDLRHIFLRTAYGRSGCHNSWGTIFGTAYLNPALGVWNHASWPGFQCYEANYPEA